MLKCPGCRQPLPVDLAIPLHFCPQCRFPLREIAGKYRLEKRLDEGGFGAVYLARHTGLRKHAMRVIKVIKPQLLADEQMQLRFAREIQVTVELSQINEHIVRIYDDFGEDPQLGHYYVMEYLEGLSLQALLTKRGRLPLRLALAIFRQLCDAMGAAHRAGVIHRDLKPANIVLIQRDLDEHFLKVIDFGIARSLLEVSQEELTRGAMGTPRYMPPEQCQNGEIDARSDIYAMGTILYEMLSGQTPFDAKELSSLLLAHIQAPPPPLATRFPDLSLPPGLDEVILQTLAKHPDQRPPSVAALWDALAPFVPAGDATIQLPGFAQSGADVGAKGEVRVSPLDETAIPGTEASLPPPVAFVPPPTDEAAALTITERAERTEAGLPSGSMLAAAMPETLTMQGVLQGQEGGETDESAALQEPRSKSVADGSDEEALPPQAPVAPPGERPGALVWWLVGMSLVLCALLVERFWPATTKAPQGPSLRDAGSPPRAIAARNPVEPRRSVAVKCQEGATRACPALGRIAKLMGTCRRGHERCTKGRWGPCVGQVKPRKERCNGKDDDCDGKVDNIASLGRACLWKKDSCKRRGRWACDRKRRRVHCRQLPLSQEQKARELWLRVRPSGTILQVARRRIVVKGTYCLARQPGARLTLEFTYPSFTHCAVRVHNQRRLRIQLRKERAAGDVRRSIGYCLLR